MLCLANVIDTKKALNTEKRKYKICQQIIQNSNSINDRCFFFHFFSIVKDGIACSFANINNGIHFKPCIILKCLKVGIKSTN